MNELPRRRHAETIARHLALRGSRVLDIGCGDGSLVGWLGREGARAVGVDPGPGALAAARRDAADIQLVAAGGERLPFADSTFDAAVCVNALHHVPLPLQAAALAEAARVVRPGGKVLVIEPLAEGPNFTLVQPVDDETAVRAAAYAAIQAAGPRLRAVLEERYDNPARYPDFAAFERRMTTVDARRAPAVARERARLEALFARLGVRDGDDIVFAQPTRANLLAVT